MPSCILPPAGIQLKNAGATHAVDTSRGDRIYLTNDVNGAVVAIGLGQSNALQRDITHLSAPKVTFADQPFQGIQNLPLDKVEDHAAPVVISAVYSVQDLAIRNASDSIRDTLAVTFTEATDLETSLPSLSSRPFLLIDSTGTAPYSVEVKMVSTAPARALQFIALSSSRGMAIPGKGDSLWIDASSPVMDSAGTAQTNEANRRASLAVKMPPFRIVTGLAPNPFRPGESTVTVVVKPEVELAGWVNYRASGNIWIYDAVGNVVVNGEPLLSGSSNKLYFDWDGMNRNGRRVGAGTYLAVVRTDDNMNGKRSTTLKIGVRN